MQFVEGLAAVIHRFFNREDY